MIKTIDEKIDELIRNASHLNNLSLSTMSDVPKEERGKTIRKVSEFIDNSWSHTYETRNIQESRFRYSPGYIDWLIGAEWNDPDLSIFIKENDEIVGLSIGFARTFLVNNLEFKAAVHTGLSVSPERKNEKIAQLIHLNKKKISLEKGYDINFFWWDGINTKKHHSYNIFKRKDKEITHKAYPMLATIFDYDRAIKNIDYPLLQKTTMKFLVRPQKNKEPNGFTIRDYDKKDIGQIQELFEEQYKKNPLNGYFYHTADELDRIISFKPEYDDSFETITRVLEKDSKIKGVIHGYKIPIVDLNEDYTFFMDGLWFTSDIKEKEKVEFIDCALEQAKEHDIYSAITIKGTYPVGNIKGSGFVPVFSKNKIPKKRVLYMGYDTINKTASYVMPYKKRIYIDHK